MKSWICIVNIALLATVLAACGQVQNAQQQFQEMEAQNKQIQSILKTSLGVENNHISTRTTNGELAEVVVIFSHSAELNKKSIEETHNAVQAAVKQTFKKTPKQVVWGVVSMPTNQQ